MSTLEKRIASALSGEITSAEISALIAETETAISEAEATAEAERTKALDLALSPDAKVAREAMQAAEFSRDRLRTVLPRLQARHQEVAAAEYLMQWRGDYEALEPERDALAKEWASYPEIAAKLIDLCSRTQAFNEKASKLHQARPSGMTGHLDGPEEVARGLDHFTRAQPSILKELRLPNWEQSEKMSWPVPSVPLALLAMVPAPFHPGADWWRLNKERGQAMREEHERIIAHYDAMARDREAREAAEEGHANRGQIKSLGRRRMI